MTSARVRRRAERPVIEVGALWPLPDGWNWSELGDVCEPSQYGWTTKADSEGDLHFLRTTDISSGRLDWDTVPFCHDAPKDVERYLVKPGDILISRAGSVGKSFLVDDAKRAVFASYLIRYRPKVEPRYVYYWLQTHAYWAQIVDNTAGIAVPNVNASKLDRIAIPLPDATTQRSIVARIDELFAELDDGEEEMRRARVDLETYRKSLLKAAVTGELTADWRSGKSGASSPLQKATDETPGRRTRQLDPSPEQTALLWALPKTWEWSQVGRMAFVTKLAGFEYTKHVVYAVDGDLPVLKAENAGPLGFRPTQYSRVRSADVSMLTRSRLEGGEVLIVFVGAGTGQVAAVPRGQEFFLGPNIGMIRPNERLIPEYLELYLRSPVGKHLLLTSMKAVAQPSLSMTTIRQTPIALPTVDEQEEIVRRAREAVGAAEDLRIEVCGGTADSFRQSILAAAFRGDLVQ